MAEGTFACPRCGKDTPHYHAPDDLGGMRAKPLQWRKPTDHPSEDDEAVATADGIGGKYSITRESDHYLLWWAWDCFVWEKHPTIEAAKSAAEADWQQRWADCALISPKADAS